MTSAGAAPSRGQGAQEASRTRRSALDVLLQVERGRRLDRALDEAAEGLSADERRQLQNAAYGVLRARGRLDARLSPLLDRPLDSLDPPVRAALRLGALELLEMDGAPPYAAVSQAVALARRARGKGAGGLVNAVLRRLQRADPPTPAEDPVARLSTDGSHPEWLVRRWLERYGPEETERIVEAGNRRPGLFLRPLGGSRQRLLERLASGGLEAAPSPIPPLVELAPGSSPARALELAPAQVQDPAASLVADFVAPPPGAVMADLCAAPGGKALALAHLGRLRRLVAMDASRARLAMVAEGARRSGARVDLVAGRAERPPFARVDGVLLDVPCTGTGTLARHPDARWRLTPASPAEMAELQVRMLQAAADVVAPGGLVVYATCSLESEENEGVVERVLAGRGDLEPEDPPEGDFPLPDGEVDGVHRNEKGLLRVLPRAGRHDGAFAVRLRKASGRSIPEMKREEARRSG